MKPRNSNSSIPQNESSPLILPPSSRQQNLDFEDEQIPVSQRLGNFSDKVFGFIFNPNTIKFGLLMFAGLCIAINLVGYYDLIGQVLSTRLDEYGRTLPVNAPLSARFINSIMRLPLLGNLIEWLDKLTGGLFVLIGAFAIWFCIQGLEIAGRFNLYFEGAAENLLYKQNRKRYESPANNNPGTKRAFKMVRQETVSILRWLSLAGIAAYLADTYAMHLTRPWIDNLGNPLWINVIWNGLAVVGVEFSLILYRGYKAVTLSNAEKTDKDRTFN
jgi:hypothetical protein